MISRNTTVVIADADAGVREIIRDLAATIPQFDVLAEADNGDRALALVLEHVPDIAVLNVRMPGRPGREVLDQIRCKGLPTRVLLITTLDHSLYMDPAFWREASGYLYEGDGLQEWLVPALKTLRKGQDFVSPTPLAALRSLFGESRSSAADPQSLTNMEMDILRLTVQGKSDKEMAFALNIPVRTVEKRKARLRKELGVGSTVEMAVCAVTQRLVAFG